MSYDSKCYDLALVFLQDHYEKVPVILAQQLAQVIQDSIETYLYAEGLCHETPDR